jgi:hypothetical protein
MDEDPKTLGEVIDDLDDTTKAAAGLFVVGALMDATDEPEGDAQPLSPEAKQSCLIALLVLLLVAALLVLVW